MIMDVTWWNIVVTACLGLPPMILAIMTIKKSIKRKKTIKILPQFSSICLGRTNEKKYIIERIVDGKSIFVCGSAGIGKTTVIGHSILECEKDLDKLYDKILYHRFSGNPSFEYACSNLAQQIDNSGSKGLSTLLSESKYLIWLDDCEQTDCLEELLRISYNPVFIISSRKKEQEKYLLSINGGIKSSLIITRLSDRVVENLLYGHICNKWFIAKKYRIINKEIVKLTNGIPLVISFIKNDKLYLKDPEYFCRILKDNYLKKEMVPPFLSERNELYSIDLLIKMAIGIDIDYQIDKISLESQKVLGFLGCISYDDFPYVNIEGMFDVFSKKVVQELLKTNLIVLHNNAIKIRHPYIHQVLRDNFDALLSKDYKIIYDFLNLVQGFFEISGNNSLELSHCLFSFKNHILSVIKIIQTNKLIANSENETSFLVALVLLAKFGFYTEANDIAKSYKLQYNGMQGKEFLHYVFIRSYEGLENFDECIACITEHGETVSESNYDEMFTAFHNLLYIYLKTNQYDKVKDKLKDIVAYIEQHNIDINKYKKDILSIKSMATELMYHCYENDNMEDFIHEQTILIENLREVFDCDDYEVIYAELILAFSLARMGYHRDAIDIFTSIFKALNNRYSFRDPLAIEVARKIAHFYFEEHNYSQTREILQCIFPYAVMTWGNEHIITKRLRDDHMRNEEKLRENSFDESEVMFQISLRPHKEDFIGKVKRLLKWI